MWTSAATGALIATASQDRLGRRSAPGRSPAARSPSLARAISAARRASSSSPRVLSAIAPHARRPHPAATRLVVRDQLRQRRDRRRRVVVDVRRARPVAEHEHVRAGSRAAAPASRRSRPGARARPGPRRTAAAPRSAPSCDQPRRGAGDEVRDHVVDGDPPAGDRDPGLPGGDERGLASRARAPPRRAPASPTSCRSRSPTRRCARRARPGRSRPRGHAQARAAPRAGRAARRPRRGRRATAPGPRRAPCAAPPRRLIPAPIASSSADAPLGRQRAAERRDADHEHVRAELRRLRRRWPRSAPAGARRARPRRRAAPASTSSRRRRRPRASP